MSHDQDNVVTAAPASEADLDNPTIALLVPGELPEEITINGVPYLRRSDKIDEVVNNIKACREIAKRTGLSLRQAIWFATSGNEYHGVMPD